MKTDTRKALTVTLVAAAMLGCAVFAAFKLMTRWDPDENWAAKVIPESGEIRNLLEKFHHEKGDFPMSLDEIDGNYANPPDYLTRNGAAPDKGRWHYNRIGKYDYQLFVTADSWVSSFDAMVYRHTGAFDEAWFSLPEASDSRELGKWRYIRGFSGFHGKHYFDADGNIQSN
ncbi:MAG: hypothetical protein AB8D78_06310 [Akkermansiaceae bacterium]